MEYLYKIKCDSNTYTDYYELECLIINFLNFYVYPSIREFESDEVDSIFNDANFCLEISNIKFNSIIYKSGEPHVKITVTVIDPAWVINRYITDGFDLDLEFKYTDEEDFMCYLTDVREIDGLDEVKTFEKY